MDIAISKFKGMAPKIEPRLLSSEYSQVSTNIKYDSGSIVPLNSFADVEIIDSVSVVASILKYRVNSTTDKWYYFNTKVSLARDPIYSANDNRIILTGLDVPRVFDNTVVATNNIINSTNTYKLGLPVPAAPTMVVATAGSGAFESRSYTVQYDRVWASDGKIDQGAYSAPATTSAAALFIDMTTSGTATIAGIADAPTGYGITHVTINRSGTTINDSFFHFVSTFEIAAAKAGTVSGVVWNSGTSTFTFTDTVLTSNLGQASNNQDYEKPSDTLSGVVAIASGMLAGFYDNYVCFSEPYQAHAWPEQYRVAIGRPVVGIGHFGDIVVVCTEAEPYIISISDPSTAIAFPIKEFAPCISADGIVSYRDAVVYPSTAGLIRVDRVGVANLTQELADIQDMKDFNLEGCKSAGLGYYYYMLYETDAGQRKMLMFNMQDPSIGFCMSAFNITCLYSDFESASMYCAHVTASNEIRLGIFDHGADYSTYNWRSKIFLMNDAGVNLAAARVTFNSADAVQNSGYLTDAELTWSNNTWAFNIIPINGFGFSDASKNYITFTLYASGEPVFTKYVFNSKPFRLPSGYTNRELEISLTGSVPVYKIELASSMQELAGQEQ